MRPRVARGRAKRSVPHYIVERSTAAPDHGDRSRQAAAHVEREKSLCFLDLTRASLFGQLLIGFKHLTNSGRPDRMTVADQAAACVHRNLDWRFGFLRTHLRKRGRAAFYELDAFARLGEAENFVRDNFCDGKT